MTASSHRRRSILVRLARKGVVLAAVSGFALTFFIAAGVIGNPWYRIISVDGGSMEPTIAAGDLIVVAPSSAHVATGTIVVLNVAGQRVTHRVVAINPDGTPVTRGDANAVNDSWGGQPVDIDAQYFATIPWVGNFLHLGETSEALFRDAVSSTTDITVGPWISRAGSTMTPGSASPPTPTVTPTAAAQSPSPPDSPTPIVSESPSGTP